MACTAIVVTCGRVHCTLLAGIYYRATSTAAVPYADVASPSRSCACRIPMFLAFDPTAANCSSAQVYARGCRFLHLVFAARHRIQCVYCRPQAPAAPILPLCAHHPCNAEFNHSAFLIPGRAPTWQDVPHNQMWSSLARATAARCAQLANTVHVR